MVEHKTDTDQKSPRSTSMLSITEASKDLCFREVGELARVDDGSGDIGRGLVAGCGARMGVPFTFGVADLSSAR